MGLLLIRRSKSKRSRRKATVLGLSMPTVKSKSIDGGRARFTRGRTSRSEYDGLTMFRFPSELQPESDRTASSDQISVRFITNATSAKKGPASCVLCPFDRRGGQGVARRTQDSGRRTGLWYGLAVANGCGRKTIQG